MKKRLLSVLLAAMVTVTAVVPAFADEEDDLSLDDLEFPGDIEDTEVE